jgi:hypothetical protein
MQLKMVELLSSCVFTGLTAVGLTQLLRSIADLTGYNHLLRKKPLGCNACMSFWSSAIASVAIFDYPHQMVLPVSAVAFAILQYTWKPPAPSIADVISGIDEL